MKPGKQLLHVLFSDPHFLPPVLRGSQLQIGSGWEVSIVGAEIRGVPPAESPSWLHGRVILIGGSALPTALRYLIFFVRVVATIARVRPKWLYLSDPLSTPVGMVGILWPGVKIVYHEHDAPPSETPSIRAKAVAVCRRFVAARADACIVPNEERMAFLPPRRVKHQRRLAVKNVPTLAETRARAVVDDEEFSLMFMGSLNPDRLPLQVLEALGRVPRARLRVVGYETVGHPGYASVVLNAARSLGIEDRVEIRGFLPSFQDLPNLIRQSHVGLSLLPVRPLDPNERTMIGASNKVFQFLACQVPVLVPDERHWREAYVETGVARSCVPSRADSVARALRWFAENREEARRMGERGRRLVLRQWNYEREFEPVLQLLNASTAEMAEASEGAQTEAVAGGHP